jgi:uncharacterized membrane protein
VYSQNAREYTLWTVTTLTSSAALLHALKRSSALNWALYTVAIAAALYADLLSVYVLLGHAVYVSVTSRCTRGRVARYAASSAIGVALFAPWVAVIAIHARHGFSETEWGATTYPLRQFTLKWAFNSAGVFFDVEYADQRYTIVAAAILGIIGYALYFLCRNASRANAYFVIILLASTVLAFLPGDLLRGSHFSTSSRYLVPTWLALELAVAYLFASMLSETLGRWRRGVWATAFVALLACGLCSSEISSAAPIWYSNNNVATVRGIAKTINEAKDPLLITEDRSGIAFVLVHYLRRDVHVLLLPHGWTGAVPSAYRSIFVLNPSDSLRARTERAKATLAPIGVATDANPLVVRFHASVNSAQEALHIKRTPYGGYSLWRLTPAEHRIVKRRR